MLGHIEQVLGHIEQVLVRIELQLEHIKLQLEHIKLGQELERVIRRRPIFQRDNIQLFQHIYRLEHIL